MKKLLLILLIVKTNIAYPQVPYEYNEYDDMPGTEEGFWILLIFLLLCAFFFGYLYGIDTRDKQIQDEEVEERIAKERTEANLQSWENLSDKEKSLWKELRTLNRFGATENEEARVIEIINELDKLDVK